MSDELFSRDDADRAPGARGRGADSSAALSRPSHKRWSPPELLSMPPDHGKTYNYRWVAEYVNGVRQNQNVSLRMREGYERVLASDLPEDFQVALDEYDDRGSYARSGGLILMRLPVEVAAERRVHYREVTARNNAAGTEMAGVAGPNAVHEDRGSKSVEGAEAAAVLNSLGRS